MNGSGERLIYGFAGFRLDAQHRVVVRDNGEPIPLAPKVFDTLLYFVERPGQLLEKQELLEAIWPNVVVEENNLNQSISTLRRVLGEHPGEHRFIVTEPGRGYRFVASVQTLPPLPQDESPGVEPVQDGHAAAGRARVFSARTTVYVASALLAAVALLLVPWYWQGGWETTAPIVSSVVPSAMRSITFPIAAPEGSRFDDFGGAPPAPALSPDGWQLAFVAPLEASSNHLRAANMERVIWIQTLGEPRARPLADTAGAVAPFWSPDGRDLAFLRSDGRLWRIPATGNGAARNISAASGFGGVWNTDETILFGLPSGLFRVSADGGEATPWTRIDDTRGEYSHRFPVMLPDGKRFLYLILSTKEEHEGLYLGSLDDRDIKQLVVHTSANAALAIGPDGRDYLFFVRDFALLAQPFDSVSGELREGPVVVARPVEPAPTVRRVAFAASGRNFVYRPRFRPNTRLLWLDRRGIPLGPVGAEAQRYSYPSLSPDGTKLAVSRLDRETDREDIWWFDLSRPVSEERLTSDPVEAGYAVWMPDGSSVMFSSARAGSWNIYRRPIDGRDYEEAVITAPTPVEKLVRDVSRDGRFLLYAGNRTLWLASLVGDPQPRALVLNQTKADARISPDGRWIAYTSGDAGGVQVYVATFPELTKRTRISTSGGSDPQWRADGRELYYIAPGPMLTAVSIAPDATNDVGNPAPLFRISPDTRSLQFGSVYVPATDGQRFLIVERAGTDELQLVVTLNWTVEP
jgi:eukaryotic-like serine/threonine-protein kinase